MRCSKDVEAEGNGQSSVDRVPGYWEENIVASVHVTDRPGRARKDAGDRLPVEDHPVIGCWSTSLGNRTDPLPHGTPSPASHAYGQFTPEIHRIRKEFASERVRRERSLFHPSPIFGTMQMNTKSPLPAFKTWCSACEGT